MNEENISEQEKLSQIAEPLPEPDDGEMRQGGAVVQTEQIENETAAADGIDLPNIDDAHVFAEQAAEAEKRFAQQQEQDQKLLEALDEVLDKRSRQIEKERSKRPGTKSERAASAVARKGVGFVSLGLILVFMGVVMIATLSARTPNYTVPLKLSPVCAIMIGAEMLITQVVTHGKPRVNIPCLVISVLIVTGCCILCTKLGGDYREETVEYNNRTVAGEIYDRSYAQFKDMADIMAVDVSVNLNPNGDGKLNGVDALSSSDIVDISVEFGGVYNSPRNFALDCKKIIDGYRRMGINITNFHFKNESHLRSYTLDVEGKYAQDLNENRLEELVNYVYIDDYDYIEDLEDYVETSNAESDTEN